MRRPRERLRLCPWPDCGKPIRDGRHEDGTPCPATCPRCGAEVDYVAGLDSLEHPTIESWSVCGTTPHGPYVSICVPDRVTS